MLGAKVELRPRLPVPPSRVRFLVTPAHLPLARGSFHQPQDLLPLLEDTVPLASLHSSEAPCSTRQGGFLKEVAHR